MTSRVQTDKIKRRMEEGYENPKKDRWAKRQRKGFTEEIMPEVLNEIIEQPIIKVGRNQFLNTIMEKKLLWFLPSNKAWARELRRFIIILFFSGLAVAVKDIFGNYSIYLPGIVVPLVTAGLAWLDKFVRELQEKK